jgi:hypothetical protein
VGEEMTNRDREMSVGEAIVWGAFGGVLGFFVSVILIMVLEKLF